jgi:hypothetical protein
VIVDLFSEPMDAVDPVETHALGRAEILVDSPRSILAEKLCALLERSELRDLIDVDALVPAVRIWMSPLPTRREETVDSLRSRSHGCCGTST